MIKIQQLSAIDDGQLQKLNILMERCDGYEPYYLTVHELGDESASQDVPAFFHYAAMDGTKLVGFLSVLVTSDSSDRSDTADGSTSYNNYEAEITSLVDPGYRRKGIFTEMLRQAHLNLTKYSITTILARLPEELYSTRIDGGEWYQELLMQLSFEDFKNHPPDNNLTFTPDTFEYYLSDEDCAYLMYFCEESNTFTSILPFDLSSIDCEEPIAVCSLDFQDGYTNLYGVFVEPALRGAGIGTHLLANFLSDYFEQYKKPLILNVRSNNIPALHLYQRFGFHISSKISFHQLICP